jgi:hypothetical protein
MSDEFPTQNVLKECFTTTAFQLFFRIRHKEDPKKSGRIGNDGTH